MLAQQLVLPEPILQPARALPQVQVRAQLQRQALA